jgi:hypothetical protein
MDTDLGRNLILWTVRASVALYVVAGWRYLFIVRKSSHVDPCYRWCWLCSWLMCVIHVSCAYHFEHRWSQSTALAHTAAMTDRVVGINWGGGLYVNYVFLCYWGFDAVRLLTNPNRSSSVLIHSVAAFMMFNATVVFGPAWWWGPLAIVVAAFFWQKGRIGTASVAGADGSGS